MATRNGGNPRAHLVTLSNNRCPLFRSALNRLPALKAISIIKHQITSKIIGARFSHQIKTRYHGAYAPLTMDETYVKVKSKWTHYYGTIDKIGANLDGLRNMNCLLLLNSWFRLI
jgi:hypothetical protein